LLPFLKCLNFNNKLFVLAAAKIQFSSSSANFLKEKLISCFYTTTDDMTNGNSLNQKKIHIRLKKIDVNITQKPYDKRFLTFRMQINIMPLKKITQKKIAFFTTMFIFASETSLP